MMGRTCCRWAPRAGRGLRPRPGARLLPVPRARPGLREPRRQSQRGAVDSPEPWPARAVARRWLEHLQLVAAQVVLQPAAAAAAAQVARAARVAQAAEAERAATACRRTKAPVAPTRCRRSQPTRRFRSC